MRLTPRKEEVQAVVALLESDGYDSAEALAKDIIKRTYEVLLERDWYAFLFRFGSGDPTLAWGPFSSDTEVERFAKALPLPGPASRASLKLYSPATQLRTDAEAIEKGGVILCTACGHPSGTHDHKGSSVCVARGCACTTFAIK